MKISVLGSGSWGTALAVLLSEIHEVTLWSFFEKEAKAIMRHMENREFLPGVQLPPGLTPTWHMEDCKESEVVVLASPSKYIRGMLQQFKPFANSAQLFVNVSKGLEEGTLLRISQVLAEELPEGCGICTLSGPSHAEEVSRRIPTAVVVSSLDMQAAKKAQSVFMRPYFRVYTNSDLVGVELGGAVKNVIALAAGMSDGLGYGDNAKAALMSRGIVEIARLGVAMGARAETFSGLTGIGDLIVTCTSMHSRNRRAGILLGQGKSLEETLREIHMVVEGVHTARSVYALALQQQISMPITEEINRVLFEQKDPRAAVNDLMSRDKTAENETDLWHF